MDPDLRVRVPCDQVWEAFRAQATGPDVPERIRSNETLLTLADVRWIYGWIRERSGQLRNNLHFHQWLEGCEMVLPEPQLPPRSPELEARVQRLRAQQDERDYQKMVENVSGGVGGRQPDGDQAFSKQLAELNGHLMLVLQFVVSVVTAFVFGHLAPYYLYGFEAQGPRILTGILVAFVVAVADLYFVIRYMLQVDGVVMADRKRR